MGRSAVLGGELARLLAGHCEPARTPCRRRGVAVLLKVYAHCIDGQADTVNKRIADALGNADAGT